MVMMPVWIAALVLLAFAYVGVVVLMAINRRSETQKAQVARRLAGLTREEVPELAVNLVKDQRLSTLSWLNDLLLRRRWSGSLGNMLKQAKIDISLGAFIMVSLLMGVCGWKVAEFLGVGAFPAVLCMLVLPPLPFAWAYMKRAKRMARLEAQLPDAMDLVGRALRSGHTFVSGLQLIQQEFGDPIKGEIAETLDEITFGVNTNDALDNLSRRVPSSDLRFFVVSVRIQTETGGNLAEIVDTISRIIRERFKLRNQVKALSAEGRLSAIFLCLLPFIIIGLLNWLNPEYISLLYTNELGKKMSYVAMALMAIGIIVMRKMINIKV